MQDAKKKEKKINLLLRAKSQNDGPFENELHYILVFSFNRKSLSFH